MQYLRGVSCFASPTEAIIKPAGIKNNMASAHGIAKGFPQPPSFPDTSNNISAATAAPNNLMLALPYSILLLFECDFKQLVLNTVQKRLP